MASGLFEEIKRLCYAGLDAPTLRRRAAEGLTRAVPVDGYCTADIDPASGLIGRVSSHADPADSARQYYEQVYFARDAEDFVNRGRGGDIIRLSSHQGSADRFLAQPAREFYATLGVAHELAELFPNGRQAWGGLILFRRSGRPEYAEREVALLRRVAPHLGAGLRAATVRAQSSAPAAPESGPGVLLLDRRGRVAHYTASAERWLSQLPDTRPDWREGTGLSTTVWIAVGALRRSLAPVTDADGYRVPSIVAQTTTGQWLRFQAELTEPRDGHSGETAIVIEPLAPRDLPWLQTAVYDLTDREQAIVDLVVRGASTRQISAAFSITEYTVQDHLKHVFDKVGVNSRRSLVERLYHASLPLRD